MCRSEPQIAQAVTLMIASRGCSIFGSGTVSQRMLPLPCHASTFMRQSLAATSYPNVGTGPAFLHNDAITGFPIGAALAGGRHGRSSCVMAGPVPAIHGGDGHAPCATILALMEPPPRGTFPIARFVPMFTPCADAM